MSSVRKRASLIALALLSLAGMSSALGQAWLPRQGDIGTLISYNDLLNKHHYTTSGDEVDLGHTQTRTTGLAVTYSPSDRWLLGASIPYVQTRFLGENHNHGPETDHGHTNSWWTDLRLEVHFQALLDPVAIAPYYAVVLPVQDYPVQGHAAPGRGLTEHWIGLFAGKALDFMLPGMYVQARANYAFVQEVADIGHDRGNLDLELGYFFTPSWAAWVLGSWQWTYGGIDVPVPPNSPLFPYHDQLAAAEFFNMTGGIGWFPGDRWNVFLNYSESLSGSNAHKVDRSWTIGVGYRFGFLFGPR